MEPPKSKFLEVLTVEKAIQLFELILESTDEIDWTHYVNNELKNLIKCIMTYVKKYSRRQKAQQDDGDIKNLLSKNKVVGQIVQTIISEGENPKTTLVVFSREHTVSKNEALMAIEELIEKIPMLFLTVVDPGLTILEKSKKSSKKTINLETAVGLQIEGAAEVETFAVETFQEAVRTNQNITEIIHSLEEQFDVDMKVERQGTFYVKGTVTARAENESDIRFTLKKAFADSQDHDVDVTVQMSGTAIPTFTVDMIPNNWSQIKCVRTKVLEHAIAESKSNNVFFQKMVSKWQTMLSENFRTNKQKAEQLVVSSQMKSLFEELCVDCVYFCCISTVGIFYGDLPWIPAGSHLLFSSVGAAFALMKKATYRVGFMAFCSTIVLLIDGCFVCQLISGVLDKDARPKGLLFGVNNVDDPVIFGGFLGAFFLSCVMTAHRIHRIRQEAENLFSYGAMGACLGGAIVYAAWVVDFGRTITTLQFHMLPCVLFVVFSATEYGVLLSQSPPKNGALREDAWCLITSIVTFVFYITFVSNVALFFGDNNSVPAMGHAYKETSAKFQGLFLSSTFMVARIIVSATVLEDLECWLRTKTTPKMHPLFRTILTVAFRLLAPICTLTIIFEENNAGFMPVFKMITLFYTTLTYFRFWLLLNVTQELSNEIVGGVGMTTDLLYVITIVYQTMTKNLHSGWFTLIVLWSTAGLAFVLSTAAIILAKITPKK
jgi:hypothetical protein